MLLPQLPGCWECRFVPPGPVMYAWVLLHKNSKKNDCNQGPNNNKYLLIACESQVITHCNKVMGQEKEQWSAIKSSHNDRHLHSIPSKVASWSLINNRAGLQPWVPDPGAPPTCFSLAFQFELTFILCLVCLVTHQTNRISTSPHMEIHLGCWCDVTDFKAEGAGSGDFTYHCLCLTLLCWSGAGNCCLWVWWGTVGSGSTKRRGPSTWSFWQLIYGKRKRHGKRTTHGSKPPTTWEAPSQDIVKAIRAAPGTSIILNRLPLPFCFPFNGQLFSS